MRCGYRNRLRVIVVAVSVALIGASLTACSASHRDRVVVSVGTSDGTPQRIAAAIYSGVLRHSGANVNDHLVIELPVRLVDDIATGAVDIAVGFSGELLSLVDPQSTAVAADDVYSQLNKAMPQGVSVGDATPVNNMLMAYTSRASGDGRCGSIPPDAPVYAVTDSASAVVAAIRAAGCRPGALELVGSPADVAERTSAGDSYGVLDAMDPRTVDGRITPLNGSDSGQRAQNLLPLIRAATLTGDQVKAVNRVAGELTDSDVATMAGRVESGHRLADVVNAWLGERGL